MQTDVKLLLEYGPDRLDRIEGTAVARLDYRLEVLLPKRPDLVRLV